MGNPDCLNSLEAASDLQMDCAAYQQNGCYTGSTYYFDENGSLKNSVVHKGCSSFIIPGGVEYKSGTFNNQDGPNTDISFTRTSCIDDLCNPTHIALNGSAPAGNIFLCLDIIF